MLGLMNMLAAIPLWGLLMLVAVLSTAISWVLVALVRRWFPHPHLKENNEFVGFTYAVYGLIYGVRSCLHDRDGLAEILRGGKRRDEGGDGTERALA